MGELTQKERTLLHDLSNELSTVKIGLYLALQKAVEDPKLSKYIKQSDDAVKRAEVLIENYRLDTKESE